MKKKKPATRLNDVAQIVESLPGGQSGIDRQVTVNNLVSDFHKKLRDLLAKNGGRVEISFIPYSSNPRIAEEDGA